MKKSKKRACHVVNSNNAIDSLPTLHISVVIIALFENICDGEPILTVISNIAEDVRYCCFSEVHVKKNDRNLAVLYLSQDGVCTGC